MELFALWKKKPQDPRVGQAWVEEKMPLYSDRARSTNKEVLVVESVEFEDIVNVFQLESIEKHGIRRTKRGVRFRSGAVLTQNGVPLHFDKKGRPHGGVPNFEKEGYKVNGVYHFERLGFLGDLEMVAKVWLVSDQYVLFRDWEDSHLSVKSYRELSELMPTHRGDYAKG
jgi:hypothetical protein